MINLRKNNKKKIAYSARFQEIYFRNKIGRLVWGFLPLMSIKINFAFDHVAMKK